MDKKDLLYVCGDCLCKKCIRIGRSCQPCADCHNKPKKNGCPYGRMFDPRILETAEILSRKKYCLYLKTKNRCNSVPDVCRQCNLNVTDEELLKAVTKAQTVLDNVHHYVVVERFEDKLVRETTVDLMKIL